MNADAAQEDRRAIEQYVRALGFYRAKSDALGNVVCLRDDFHLVEPWVLRRPKRQLRVEEDLGAPLGIRLEHLAEFGFGNSNCDLLLKFGSVQLYPALDVLG